MELALSHTRQDTFERDIYFTDAAGVAIDLTGASVKFTLKRDVSDVTPLASATAVVTVPASGKASISIPGASMDISEGVYRYDIQLTDSLGAVTTVLKGPFSITYNVTV